MNQQPKYHRILLKLSGEALANGKKDSILDFAFIDEVAGVLKKCLAAGVEIGIVVGAGNIWRGVTGSVKMQRTRADHMGMLATTMNAIALSDAFIRNGMDAVVMSAMEMDTYADHYTTRHADRLLKEGKIVIFAGGTGSPYFSTDTGAALRAAEIGADAMLMEKNIDFVYDSDPRRNKNARLIDTVDDISEEILAYAGGVGSNRGTGGMITKLKAAQIATAAGIPMMIFNGRDPRVLYSVIDGQRTGTYFSAKKKEEN